MNSNVVFIFKWTVKFDAIALRNITVDSREIGCKALDCIHLTHGKFRPRTSVKHLKPSGNYMYQLS
jgi:hypothetical protein